MKAIWTFGSLLVVCTFAVASTPENEFGALCAAAKKLNQETGNDRAYHAIRLKQYPAQADLIEAKLRLTRRETGLKEFRVTSQKVVDGFAQHILKTLTPESKTRFEQLRVQSRLEIGVIKEASPKLTGEPFHPKPRQRSDRCFFRCF